MALRDLLVYLDQAEAAVVRLRLAVDLAYRHASRLTALYVREYSRAQLHEQGVAELGLAPAAELERLDRSIETSIDKAANRLRSALADLARERGLKVEWRCVNGPASAVVPQHARYADLCILGHVAADSADSFEYAFSDSVLFASGRPLLFVPSVGAFNVLGRHIMVAWNSSPAAARAVNDALPLIERAERTTVLTVNAVDFIDGHGALPAQQMVKHLAQHGASAELVQLEHVPSGSIASAIQAEARARCADLVVAGAFGRPKHWEKLLGGVTRDLLAHMSLPIMMSH